MMSVITLLAAVTPARDTWLESRRRSVTALDWALTERLKFVYQKLMWTRTGAFVPNGM